VLQAADHQLGEDDHAGAAHARATVHHHRGIQALGGVQHGVGVAAHRLDLLQVGWGEGRRGREGKEEKEGRVVEGG